MKRYTLVTKEGSTFTIDGTKLDWSQDGKLMFVKGGDGRTVAILSVENVAGIFEPEAEK